MNRQHTTDEIFPLKESTREEPIRFLDIHLYEPEPEEPPSVESQREPEFAPLNESEDTKPGHPHRKRRNIIALSASIMCVLIVSTLVFVFLLPLLTPDATITIVPSSRQVRTTTTITVTTGAATGTQLQGRALAAITMNQARTVATTGKGHQDAKAGQGSLTFYNAAPYPQTVTAGTILTGADGVQIVTDQDATIAAVRYPTLGQTTVTAHAVITGSGSNIAGGDIYGPCCRLNVSAVNSAFSGGQQARDYQTVTQQDINTVVTSLKTSVNQSAQAALQTQVHSDETLITPLPCQQSIKPDHQPGEEAAQVTLLVSETCTGMAYSTQALHALATQIITQQTNKRRGDGYRMQGDVQVSITGLSRKGLATMLHATIAATWQYQFTSAQQAQIKAQIAGKSKSQALQILQHIPGIQTANIESEHIPPGSAHIHLIFFLIQ